ncbi:MAG: response regulator transcription factor [Acidimicrobiales bacterium]
MTAVIVVDDEPAMRESIATILGAEDDIDVVATAAGGEQALELLAGTRVDVMVMDLRMPGMDGEEATRRLLERPAPRPAVLVLTAFATDEAALSAIRAGASGFCAKTDRPEALADAVRVVARGDAVVSPAVLRALLERLAPHAPGAGLARDVTSRELAVLRLVAAGASNEEICQELLVAETTVRSHVAHLRTKLGARSRAELVVKAWEAGIRRS